VFGVVVLAVLFLSAYFNWGRRWKSHRRRVYFILASGSMIVSAVVELILESQQLGLSHNVLLDLLPMIFFILGVVFFVAVLATSNEPT